MRGTLYLNWLFCPIERTRHWNRLHTLHKSCRLVGDSILISVDRASRNAPIHTSQPAIHPPTCYLHPVFTLAATTTTLAGNGTTGNPTCGTTSPTPTMMVAFIRPLASRFMMKPRAQRLKRIQLWMIRKDDDASTKTTGQSHDRSPEFQ